MIKYSVASTSTCFEPRTAATATTAFPRFRDGAAFAAYGTDGRRGGSWYCVYICWYWSNTQTTKTFEQPLGENGYRCHVIALELTCAGLHALKPLVTNVPIAGTSTVLKPSTARSATTDSAGFLECATL